MGRCEMLEEELNSLETVLVDRNKLVKLTNLPWMIRSVYIMAKYSLFPLYTCKILRSRPRCLHWYRTPEPIYRLELRSQHIIFCRLSVRYLYNVRVTKFLATDFTIVVEIEIVKGKAKILPTVGSWFRQTGRDKLIIGESPVVIDIHIAILQLIYLYCWFLYLIISRIS